MKTLSNLNVTVPESTDPPLVKPLSDALEAVDTALGAKVSTLNTTAKTLVGAINEVNATSYRGALNSITDLADVKNGAYIQDSATAWPLRPTGAGVYGMLFSVAPHGVGGYKFLQYLDATAGDLYVKFWGPYSGTAWKKVTATAV